MTKKIFILCFILGGTFILLLIPMFNYFVDPYSIFFTNNLHKYKHLNYRITNSITLKIQEFDTLIIGTSRTQGAINPTNPNFAGRTYNISMSGSNVYEMEKVFDFAIHEQKHLDVIIYGVDFLTFVDTRYPGKQFNESLFNSHNNLYDTLYKHLFSTITLKDSIKTLRYNHKRKKSNYIYGYEKKRTPSNKELNNNFKSILTNNFLVNPGTYGCYSGHDNRLTLFSNILDLVYKKQVRLKLFIPPLHYRQYIALYHLGLLDIYFTWIKDIVNQVDRVNKLHTSDLIELYDFSGINHVTTEILPRDGHGTMEYHFESSHYTSKVGDLIINQLYGKNSFGTKLNNININLYVASQKKKMMMFFDGQNDTMLEIKKLFTQTSTQRRTNCAPYQNVLTKME